MDRCSYFIQDRALFGSFPTQEAIEELEANGVRYFVNLTFSYEKRIIPYTTKYNYINHPIPDHRTPTNWTYFARFIVNICKVISRLRDGEKLYVHCKGGHGRSGIVVACILCYMENITPGEALERTTRYHNNRNEMKEKWRKIGSPQSKYQKIFVHKFFEPLNFYRTYKSGPTCGFSNFSLHEVEVPNVGTFPSSEAAWQACKDPDNEEYVQAQLRSQTPGMSKFIGRRCTLRSDWNEVKRDKLKEILLLKFEQHPEIKQNLINTGFRPLIECKFVNSENVINDTDINGSNMLGELLTQIRNEYYEIE